MEYTVNKLARLSGISPRTLRYYDQIGLLRPVRSSSSGYRIYGRREVDRLQQILFYRELGVVLEDIGRILDAPGYDAERALTGHLSALLQKRDQIERLIRNVTQTIGALKGEIIMSDPEKFEGFKQKMIEDNEAAYGEEVRRSYGDSVVNASNEKVKSMSSEQWQRVQELNRLISEALTSAVSQGDPAGEMAQKACDLHRQWLCLFWPDGLYSTESHLALAQMYCDDERFKQYYEAITPGATEFLLEAMKIYCA